MTKPDQVKHCTDRAFYAYGTSQLFDRRAQKLTPLRNSITFLGIAVPLVMGSLYLSFGSMPKLMPYLLIFAGIIGTAQLALSTWSIVARWDEKYSYAVGSVQANTRLFNAWTRLSKRSQVEIDNSIPDLDAEDQRQEQSDLTQNITEKEKRYAMRSSLYYFGLPCRVCNQKPTTISPSNCDCCGNF